MSEGGSFVGGKGGQKRGREDGWERICKGFSFVLRKGRRGWEGGYGGKKGRRE